MTNTNNDIRIERYIDVIEPITEGQRNSTMYKLGLLFRSNFGLQGIALIEWLQYANREKCTPPLSDTDIQRIARSVDKSNVSLEGNTDGTATLEGCLRW